MDKHILIALLLCLSGLQGYSQSKKNEISNKNVNWGLKVGLNSLHPAYYNAYYNDVLQGEASVKNEVGYTGSVFMRINLSNFFMQPEVAFSETKQKLYFSTISETNPESGVSRSVSLKNYSLNVPVLLGYNAVKEGSFLVNVFCGPAISYTYETQFESNGISFEEHHSDWNSDMIRINLLTGVSFNISNLHFDFRYEVYLADSDLNFSNITQSPSFLNGTYLEKKENALHFSCGIMF